MPSVQLVSSDKIKIALDIDAIPLIGTIKNMLESDSTQCHDGTVIPLPELPSEVLQKVVKWASFHKQDLSPNGGDKNPLNYIALWDEEFIQVEQAELFELARAANYLDAKGLCDLCFKTIANIIADKTPEEIREALNLENDLTPTEEAQMGKEHLWDAAIPQTYSVLEKYNLRYRRMK